MKTDRVNGGVGFLTLVFIVLFIIKLVFPASISWLTVFIPVFISIGLFIITLVSLFIIAVLAAKNRRL